jgi:glucokinase
MNEFYSVGIDVGGTKTAFGLFDENQKLVSTKRVPTIQGQTPDIFINGLANHVQSLCDSNHIDIKKLLGVGVGMPCFIRQKDGYIFKSTNIPSLHGFMAKDKISESLGGIRVELDNDTHAAALAENRQGAGKGVENMLYCAVSSGIATAPIIHGELFRGTYGFSGESGHMIITPGEGIRCACGKKGCFMSWCSGIMIVKHVQQWISEGGTTIMTELVGGACNISTKEIAEAWRLNDSMATRAVKQMQHYFALWFYNLYLFTNIPYFVLGGGLLKMGDDFWSQIFDEFNDLNCDTSSECPVTFKKAKLIENFGIIGANELLY